MSRIKYHTFGAITERLALSFAILVIAAYPSQNALAQPADAAGWRGNFALNPGFEEDWVNVNGEGHVLSFKGDWFYNQQDLKPDYWTLKESWTWTSDAPKSGRHALRLAAGATAEQYYPGMTYQEGGGAWGGAAQTPMKLSDPRAVQRSWRARVWVRGAGSIDLGGATAKATGDAWQQLEVVLPAEKAVATEATKLVLTGPAEFDDLVVEQQTPPGPNLAPNSGFEESDERGQPRFFSSQRKYHSLGPTYYV